MGSQGAPPGRALDVSPSASPSNSSGNLSGKAPKSSRWILDPFVVSLLVIVVLATVFPARGALDQWLGRAMPLAIAALFFLYGVRLPSQEALAAVRNWRLQAWVLAVTYVVFPAVGFLASWIAQGFVPPELAQGLLFVALMPSTIQSSIAFTSMAGGNVAAAVCAASLSNLAGVVLTPMLIGILLSGGVALSASSLGSIAGQLLVPFILGQLARPRLGSWIHRRARLLFFADRGTILLVVYVAFARGVTQGSWSSVSGADISFVVVACLALFVAMSSATVVGGRLLRWPRGDRIVLWLCGSQKSLASGLPMATILLPVGSVGLIVLPLMIYHQLQLVAGSVLTKWVGARHSNTAR